MIQASARAWFTLRFSQKKRIITTLLICVATSGVIWLMWIWLRHFYFVLPGGSVLVEGKVVSTAKVYRNLDGVLLVRLPENIIFLILPKRKYLGVPDNFNFTCNSIFVYSHHYPDYGIELAPRGFDCDIRLQLSKCKARFSDWGDGKVVEVCW